MSMTGRTRRAAVLETRLIGSLGYHSARGAALGAGYFFYYTVTGNDIIVPFQINHDVCRRRSIAIVALVSRWWSR
jgi:hypothetical protein